MKNRTFIDEETLQRYELHGTMPIVNPDFIIIKPTEPERWRASRSDQYWYVDDISIVPAEDTETGHDFDDQRWRSGNYFALWDDANAAAKQIREVLKQAQEAINGRS